MGTTQKEAEQMVEIILASMVRALSTGDKVEIRGFGSLHKRIPFFKASKEVLKVLNQPAAERADLDMVSGTSR